MDLITGIQSKMLDRSKGSGAHLRPYLRNVNVQWGRIELDDVLLMDIPPDQEERYRLKSGDLLVCEGGEIGRCAIWQGGDTYMAYQKALHRVRPLAGIDPRFLRYWLEYLSRQGTLISYSSGSTIKHLPQEQLRRLPLALPPLPEQRRIVATLEDHLSRIEAALSLIRTSQRRLGTLSKRMLIESVPVPSPTHWDIRTVADAGSVSLGRQRHPDWHHGPNMRPYLRVANVFEDRIDEEDVMEMDFPPEVFDKYRLQVGDVLLNEGQSPELLGRPALYRGSPKNVAFTNSLLRFQARSDIDPEWALLVFRRHMHAGRFRREVRITTNIAHLSASRFKSVEFPVPPMAEQKKIINETRERLAIVDRLSSAVAQCQSKASKLREALLRDAFTGRLVEQDSNDGPAAEPVTKVTVDRGTGRPAANTPLIRAAELAPWHSSLGRANAYMQQELPL